MKTKWNQITKLWKWFGDQATKMWNDVVDSKRLDSVNDRGFSTKAEWGRIAGQWNRFQGDAKERWGKLTDSDLLEVNGRYDALAEKILEKYGIEKEEANNQIDVWANMLSVY